MTDEERNQVMLLVETLNTTTDALKQATAKINQQTTLIELLSKQNLILVAKLDELTGRKNSTKDFYLN